MLVYKATNTINGMVYIGATTQSLARRKNDHKKDAAQMRWEGSAFHRAIREHGFDSFTWEVIAECRDLQSLHAAEIDAIARLGAQGGGYNLTAGGPGLNGYSFSEETKAKMSLSAKARKSPPMSEECKQKLRTINKARPLTFYGRKLDRAEYQSIAARRAAGETYRLIGLSYGVSPPAIFHFLEREAMRQGAMA